MTDAERDQFDRDDALRARLQAGDPAASLSPADPTVVARLLEDTMSSDLSTETRSDGTRNRGPLTWLVAAAAVLLIAGVGFYALANRGDDKVPAAQDPGTTGSTEPTVTHLTAPSAAAGRCMVPTADVLSQQTLAFEGTVQSMVGGVVTLEPSHFYAGDATDVVEVQAPPDELAQLIGAVDFQQGGTYLVSATGGRVTVCGFSGPATPALQSLYDAAFPG
jgi:hypothetical protein